MGFTLTSNPYESVIDILTRNVDFVQSEHFQQLIGTGSDLPGVVAAAYARFVASQIRNLPAYEVHALVDPLNELSALQDYRVDTMLREEVLEELEASEVIDEAQKGFCPRLAKLFVSYGDRE
jgi:hypothetical protein